MYCVPLEPVVPVFFDKGRGKTKVWAFLGWGTSFVTVGFDRDPSVKVFDRKGRPVKRRIDVRFDPLFSQLVYPVFHELYVSKILDRDAFRAVCDRHQTAKAIVAELV